VQSRTSAAYRDLYVFLQEHGAKDFFWRGRIIDIDRNEMLFATLEETLAFMLFRRLCFVARYQNAVCTNSWPRD
jgi:hypothetical protein